MASTDARPIPIKNTAYRFGFPIMDADGDFVSGAAGLDSEVSKDFAAYADCTNEATEIGSSGTYYLDLTATEMNADCVMVVVKTSTTGAKSQLIVLYPQESGDIKVDVQSYGGTAGTFSGGRPEVNTTHAAGTAWGSGAITAGSIAADAIGASELAADAATEIATAVWAATTRLLSAGTNIVLAKGTGVTGFNDLDAAGVRGAVGLTSANVDTQLSAISSKTTNLPSDPADQSLIIQATDAILTAVGDVPTNAELAAALGALSIPSAGDNASAVLAKAFEGAETVQDFLRLARAALYGKSTGMETTSPAFRDKADTKNRIQVVGADENGNRPTVNLDAS